MYSNTQFSELLKSAFINENNDIRRQNELLLTSFMQEQPNEFVSATSKVILTKEMDASTKSLASTTLCLAFKVKKNDECPAHWRAIKPEIQEMLKGAAFEILVDKNAQLRRSAANLLALLYTLDLLSNKKWSDILSGICSNVNHANKDFGSISVTTLACICDYLTPARMALVDENSQNILLGGLCNALKIKDENSQSTVKAFKDSMLWLSQRFQNVEFLSFIYQYMIEYLDYSLETGNAELAQETINCFSESIKYTYPNFEPYHKIIFDKMIDCERFKEPKVRIATFEFFIRCLKYEEKVKRDYFRHHWHTLIQIALQRLYQCISFDESEYESTLASLENTGAFMGALNKFYLTAVFQSLVDFIQEHIQQPDEKSKIAAVMALESMVEASNDPASCQLFYQVFMGAFELVKTGQTPILRIVAMNCVDKIISQFIEIPLDPQNVQVLIPDLLRILQHKDDSEVSIQIKMLVCHAIENLATKTRKKPNLMPTIQNQITPIFGVFFGMLNFTQNHHLIDIIFSTMFTYIESILTPFHLNHYFPILVDMLHHVQVNYNAENKTMIIESLLINLNVIIVVLNNQGSKLEIENQGMNTQTYVSELFKFIATLLEESNNLSSEAITLMSTIMVQFKDHFEPAVPEFFARYVQNGLSNPLDVSMMNASIVSFTNLLKVFPGKFKQEVVDFIQYVFVLINQPEFPKELKVPIYYFLSDVILMNGDLILGRLDEVMLMNGQALEFVLYYIKVENWNEEMLDFCLSFRDVVVENILCVLHGLYLSTQYNVSGIVEHRMDKIQVLFKSLTDDSLSPSLDFCKTVLNVVTDYFAKNRRIEKVDMQMVEHLVCLVKTSVDDEEVGELLARMREVNLYV